ncbi:sensor histidine kinase [Actinoallomurus sp. CA-142502]|uniref:sensor histidine kinase n=1 Tax=Actinoallomurus sp. CA-142502 TaxID=3239885 RepID=UPI003D903386
MHGPNPIFADTRAYRQSNEADNSKIDIAVSAPRPDVANSTGPLDRAGHGIVTNPADVRARPGNSLHTGERMNAHSTTKNETTIEVVEERFASTEELRELSRDVHDRIAHSVLTVLNSLELVELEREAAEPATRSRLAQAKRSTAETLEEVRRLAARLRVLAERVTHPWNDAPRKAESWNDAHRRADRVCKATAAPADQARTTVPGEASEVHDELFLVVREAVFNAVTHARAKCVAVDVRADGDWINAVVEDDGSGFEPHRLPPAKSVGLVSMRERTVRVGGRLDIASCPCCGTRVTIGMPLRGALREHGG